ncbi:hypothetical protein [Pseudomonas sp. PDM13]|uniref:hypothetical protein n=1 Tax=Pseudomonas sp. PDM13 TaxID=2769255 RepID=UPI0021E0EE9E|nr:hypothetical protein [Pseudomonas sp. PDM13]MCU9950993.1 hypothetical protein [Pseudomonas sp. PDM13]
MHHGILDTAELYSPEKETTIEERAFKRTSIPRAVANTLSPSDASLNSHHAYDPGNTRALVKVRDEPIFIDRYGWTRQGDRYGKVSIDQIGEVLDSGCSETP